ncbi:MAG: hypothetical protein QOH78_894, partial [Verrucomicrobiota bacterium]
SPERCVFDQQRQKLDNENEDEDEHDRRNASTFVVLTVATEIVGSPPIVLVIDF